MEYDNILRLLQYTLPLVGYIQFGIADKSVTINMDITDGISVYTLGGHTNHGDSVEGATKQVMSLYESGYFE